MPLLSANRTITRLLSQPSKVARSLEWNKLSGSILSLHVGPQTCDLAVASHPSCFHPIDALPSIPIELETRKNQKVLKGKVLFELSSIVDAHNICGLLVSWPVQKEGWCGATCGKVLHILDQIAEETKIISPKRPVCLWDGHHFREGGDQWGRLSIYAVPSSKTEHFASKEQYQDEGMLAADVAADFLIFHWPDLAHNLNYGPSGVSSHGADIRGALGSSM